MYTLGYGNSIYEATCVDPLIKLTISVVKADDVGFQIIWMVMACLVQLIYGSFLISKDAHVQFQIYEGSVKAYVF